MNFDRTETLKKSMECFVSGNFDTALSYAQQILEHFPIDLQIMTFMSVIKNVMGKESESEDLLKKVLEIDPNYPEALYYSGIRAGKKGDYTKSALLIQKAIDHQSKDAKPELAEYYQNLGSALWKLNLRFDAFRAWQKSIELNPEQKMAKDYITKFSNEYGQPKAPTKEFDDYYAFQSIKIDEYLQRNNKIEFDNLNESNEVIKKVIDKWKEILNNIDLSILTTDEKIKIFKDTQVDF